MSSETEVMPHIDIQQEGFLRIDEHGVIEVRDFVVTHGTLDDLAQEINRRILLAASKLSSRKARTQEDDTSDNVSRVDR